MTPAEEQVERCDLCGTPLSLSAGAPGCLSCLLAGGCDGAQERRYQHYELTMREEGMTPAELGRGAMGITYRALDLNLGAPVALKVISARYSNQPEARDRFRREARAAAQLRHPNVASVYHFGETATGQCFYAMELVEGETLEARVRREGPLGAKVGLEIAGQVAQALLAAEKHGLVHRDLKPSNLMLVPNESGNERAPRVKVIDFGLAKAISGQGEASNPTHTGFAGTPGFASPEQFQAEGQNLDTRSDLYSLGATLWYALTEEIPLPGDGLPVDRLAARKVPAPIIRLLRRALATDPAERPQSARAFLAELELCQAAMEAAPRRRQRLRRAALGLAFFTICGAGLTSYLLHRQQARAPVPPEKSIAVLPFANLSTDKENAFFAEGVQDDILTALGKIADLKVIARASVMNYGAGQGRDLGEIGQALGVAKVLEGSVRRAGDKVRVTAQLIDTRTNTQLWAESYDRGLADIFAVEVEVAESVASALQTVIRPEEKARVQAKPTENPDAYVLYLRAREYQTRPTGLLQDYQTAADLYTQALALDPRFALAHARLSATLAYTYLNFLPTAEIKRRARAEADEALRLQPDLGEARVAYALCLYWTEKNYEAALHELELATQLLPNDAEIDVFSAFICRRQGRWSAAIAGMERASARDPRNPLLAREVMLTNWLVRDWLAAARGGDRALALAPDLPLLRVERTYVYIWSKGELAPLRAALTAIPPGADPDGEVTLARWDAALLGHDFAAAERAVAALQSERALTPFGVPLPKSYLWGCAALASGQSQLAKPFLESARPPMEAEARAFPLDPFRQAQLGLLYAHLGRKEDALRQGLRAVELLPESKDALYGPTLSGLLALIYARTGESDQAMTLLERLLTVPGPVSQVSESSITLSDLRLRWQWDPLRGDPRFQRIIAGPEPKTIYR